MLIFVLKQARRTSNEFRIIDADKTSALLSACRKRKVTISSVLCAAAALGASDVMGDGSTPATTQRYKVGFILLPVLFSPFLDTLF